MAVVVIGGCRPPQAPVDVAGKNVPVDLVLGAKRAVARAPVPPAAFDLGPDGLPLLSFDLSPSGRPVRTRTTQGRDACPDDPLAKPKVEAPRRPLGAPTPETYTFASSGYFKDGDEVTLLPSTATVEVLNVVPLDPLAVPPRVDNTWDVAVTLGDRTTTSSYRSRNLDGGASQETEQEVDDRAPEYPEGSDPFADNPRQLTGKVTIPPDPTAETDKPNPPPGLVAGLYLEKVQEEGSQRAFQPQGGLLLARYPITIGEYYDVSASDAGATMSYRTIVTGKKQIIACGVATDTWTIELTKGRNVTAETGEVVEFTARYQVATTAGGLIVESETGVRGTAALTAIERSIQMVTTTAPS